MNIISLMVLAFGMSMDAFAAAIATTVAKGAPHQNTGFAQALKTGLLFGLIEGFAPIIGWFFGEAAQGWLSHVDHWVAFGLLVFLALKFMHDALQNKKQVASVNQHQFNKKNGFGLILVTAVATSIDSLVIGVSLAFLKIDIWVAATLIGMATTIMVTLGLYLGNRLGQRFGTMAMFVGGVVLLMIGAMILVSHLLGMA